MGKVIMRGLFNKFGLDWDWYRILFTVTLKRCFVIALTAMVDLLPCNADFGGVRNLKNTFSYDFAYSTEKIKGEDFIGCNKTFEMKLAKNERKACQFVLRDRAGGGNYQLQGRSAVSGELPG